VLDKKFKHDLEVVVDRLAVKAGIETRLADSFEQALKLADGLAYVDLADTTVAEALAGRLDVRPAGIGPDAEAVETAAAEKGGAMKGTGLPPNRIVFSERFACPVSGFTIEDVEPRLFSFNAPQGACSTCDGIGEKQLFDPQLVVPNEHLSLKKARWCRGRSPTRHRLITCRCWPVWPRSSSSRSTRRGAT
jgi:excinuclease ABC subunit A